MAGHLYVSPMELLHALQSNAQSHPLLFWPSFLLLSALAAFSGLYVIVYIILLVVAPIPRDPLETENTYITTTKEGRTSSPQPLPNWYDSWAARCRIAETTEGANEKLAAKERAKGFIEPPDVAISVVIPAYNEEKRLESMLREAVTYLDQEYGRPAVNTIELEGSASTGLEVNGNGTRRRTLSSNPSPSSTSNPKGYEILLVNDGSTDSTVEVALDFSHKHRLHDILRITTLIKNRGKGGAVCHGLRHAGGEYAIFADADGASRFSDMGKLVEGCKKIEDDGGRGVAVGSRAHLVGSEAIVKRSALRNTLMHLFHLFLRILTPPATSRIRDTQCGFKLFSRKALPYIIPYMHAEGWIFDVEMLMLAESSPAITSSEAENKDEKGREKGRKGIKVAEVPIHWNEVGGSKLNVMWDSLGMAWGLAVLRASWMLGVYSR